MITTEINKTPSEDENPIDPPKTTIPEASPQSGAQPLAHQETWVDPLEGSSLGVNRKHVQFDEVISIREMLRTDPQRAEALFQRGFEIYCEAFPDPSERESAESLRGYLDDPSTGFQMIVVTMNGAVVGGRNFGAKTAVLENGEKFPIACGEHLYIPKALQRLGFGTEIVKQTNAMARSYGASLIISEQNDPFLMTPEEKALDASAGISPEDRLKFWKKQGYVAFDCPYAQPSLDGGDPVYYLRLTAEILDRSKIPESANFDGKSINSDAVLGIMRAYHGGFVDDLDSDPTSVMLKEKLLSRKRIDLIDIEQERSFAQDRVDLR
ncbi:MAG: hypothetical protein KDD70_05020 [Bdellovibrionales bacterium]|nr:hypothetical protein [Bdellovibrionales bacterium]